MALSAILLSGGWYWQHTRALERQLVREWPAQLQQQPAMLRFAVSLARPVYSAHCAVCHGADMSGNRQIGAPSLSDGVWLYGDGGIGNTEATILYGIRSGHPKAHNVTDMPAMGRIHQLSAQEVDDVVEFVLNLSHQEYNEPAAARGKRIFYDKGNCFDCHAGDAMGNTDYGTPGLLGPSWNYGGDRASLRRTVYSGRHGLCPAWIEKLTPAEVRALAAYLFVVSHPTTNQTPR